jgi:FkbM family methyltransferase
MVDQPGTSYLWALPFLQTPIRSIVEVGSRDGLDAVALARIFESSVTSFECDPGMFPVVEQNIAESGISQAHAHAIALSDEDGEVEFWAHDPDAYEHGGTGSLFLVNFANRARDDVDSGRAPIQRAVKVRAARFDGLGIEAPDLLVMDVQGAECKVLRGFGDLLSRCRYVICEAERVPSYQGGNPFSEVNRMLKSEGFKLIGSTIGNGSTKDRWLNWWRVNARIAAKENTLRPDRVYQGIFDVVYENVHLIT